MLCVKETGPPTRVVSFFINFIFFYCHSWRKGSVVEYGHTIHCHRWKETARVGGHFTLRVCKVSKLKKKRVNTKLHDSCPSSIMFWSLSVIRIISWLRLIVLW